MNGIRAHGRGIFESMSYNTAEGHDVKFKWVFKRRIDNLKVSL